MSVTDTINICDSTGFVIGENDKELAHQQGDWHRTFHLWIYYRANGKTYQILQVRSSRKRIYPGLIDCSVAGHYEKNEVLSDGVREVREELGLSIDFSQLKFLGIRKSEIADNKEFQFVFLLNRFVDLAEIQCDPNEIESFLQVENDELIALLSGKIEKLNCPGICFVGKEKLRKEIVISKEDFIPTRDKYFESIASIIAGRSLEKESQQHFDGIRNFAEGFELDNKKIISEYLHGISESEFNSQFQKIISNRFSELLFLKSLIQFNHISSELISFLLNTVDAPDGLIRKRIYCIGWQKSSAAINALKKLSRHQNPDVRAPAVFVLGEICESEEFNFLGEMINDADDLVTKSASFSLGWNQGRQRLSVLENVLKKIKPEKKVFVEKALKMFDV